MDGMKKKDWDTVRLLSHAMSHQLKKEGVDIHFFTLAALVSSMCQEVVSNDETGPQKCRKTLSSFIEAVEAALFPKEK